MAAWFRRRGEPAAEPAPEPSPEDVARFYHRRTKHHVQRYARGPHDLDWANQPDPFRRYEGAELVRLSLPDEDGGPAYEDARIEGSTPPCALDERALSALFFDSLALSAWKQAGEARWSLRVNPSSGNLHPTEAYAITPAVPGLCAAPAVWHYAPREHGLERRCDVPPDLQAELPAAALLVILTSIDWREAWKYGERAFRYSSHDLGHALAALALAASARGLRARVLEGSDADVLHALCGVERRPGPEAETAEALVAIAPREPAAARVAPETARRFRALAWSGAPNPLSPEHVEWEVIDAVREATADRGRAPRAITLEPRAPGDAGAPIADPSTLRRVARGRRSAVAMDGCTALAREGFLRMLARTLPRAGEAALAVLAAPARVHLLIFVHRVDGLAPGLYLFEREPERGRALAAALRPELLRERVPGVDLPLSLCLPRDLRGVAAQIACHQSIAGDGAFSLAMVADLERALADDGARAYPRLFHECGAIGQVLYLEAEALGVSATGIGCYFDDEMHALCGLLDGEWQDLYHFTVGGRVDDPRLVTTPAYQRDRGESLDSSA